jgi:chromosome segregation ATPase
VTQHKEYLIDVEPSENPGELEMAMSSLPEQIYQASATIAIDISQREVERLEEEIKHLKFLNVHFAEQVSCEIEHARVARMQREEMAGKLKAAEEEIAFLKDLNAKLYARQTAANQECEIAEDKLAKAEAEVGTLFRLLHTLWLDIERGGEDFDLQAMCDCDRLFVTELKEEACGE